MSPAFSTRPRRANPRLAKDSPFNFHPPPSFGGRVVLNMCLPALCLLAFQLDHTGQTQDLPKIHLSTSTPPSKTTTGPLSSCLLKRTRKTPFGGRVVLIMCLPALCLLAFQLDHTGQTQDLPKIHLSTSTPPLQNNHGSFVILSSKKKPEKHHLEEG